jgi:RNase H-fold protein (predicted Holliday junction resolvase)
LVDRVSATIILQGYMESAGRFRADGPVSGKE